jgi:hypothetical protein
LRSGREVLLPPLQPATEEEGRLDAAAVKDVFMRVREVASGLPESVMVN